MSRLLKLEWLKIYNYNTARVFLILYILLLVFFGFLAAKFEFNINNVSINFAKLGAFKFPNVWYNVAYIVSASKLFLALLIIMNVTNEYSYNLTKQNLIDGLTKKEFLTSKLLSTLVIAIISTIFVFFISLGLGIYFSEDKTDMFKGVSFVGIYFLNILGFLTLCVFAAFLTKKNAISLILIFFWWILEFIIRGIEYYVRISSFNQSASEIKLFSSYLPMATFSNLLQFPPLNLNAVVMGGEIFKPTEVHWDFVVASIVYIILFVLGSYTLLKKRDL